MGSLKCDYKVVGAVQTNCYFLYNEETKDCVIFDPGDQAEELINYVRKKELIPQAIYLTHGHFDHIMAAERLREEFGIKIYASEAEQELIMDTKQNVSAMFGRPVSLQPDEGLSDGQELTVLGQTMRCILTPGHTCGGMCYYFPKEGILFSGDTLFQQSVGRTDFPTGSMSQLIRSVREALFVLPDIVRVYPGHGMMTTIQEEKLLNPYAAQ